MPFPIAQFSCGCSWDCALILDAVKWLKIKASEGFGCFSSFFIALFMLPESGTLSLPPGTLCYEAVHGSLHCAQFWHSFLHCGTVLLPLASAGWKTVLFTVLFCALFSVTFYIFFGRIA